MTIDIIGAGIGGLTTAIALAQKGIKTRVFEQASVITPVGAGIILASNAMQVYDKLGLREVIEGKGKRIEILQITKPNLKPISKVDLAYFENKHQVKTIAIHRATLQQILIDHLTKTELILDHKITKISPWKTGYNLEFKNGKKYYSSKLIGADGIKSTVRKQLFSKTKIRNAKQVCWRGVTTYNLPLTHQSVVSEAWGKEARFGLVPLGNNKVYWFALKSFKSNPKEFSVQQIENYFKGFNPIVKDIINVTKQEHIHTAEITDLKPIHVWHKQNACLIGDAAHATTPNMGQGACQAIEDAYILSECLAKYSTNTAFNKYQQIRLNKAHNVVNTSWIIGKLAHTQNPILYTLRNLALKATPAFISRKQSAALFKLAKV